MRHAPTTLLFDFDGTLADTTALILRCFRAAFADEFGLTLPDARYIATFGIPLRRAMELLLRELTDEGRATIPDISARADQITAAYRARHETLHDEMINAFPGVLSVVQEAAQRGLRLAIVTSKKRPSAERGLRHLGLAPYFSVLVCGEETPHGKPHPAPVLAALSQLKAAPHEAVMIGDSPHDIEAGRGAGVRTAAVLWGPFSRADLSPARPDHWFEAPHELTALFS